MPKAVNYLKNMKINEISLVTDPACPGAVVLFTKKHDIVIHKDGHDVSGEPRDERGRWTRAAVAAMGHVKGAARQVAQALSNRAKAAASATVGNTVAVIRTTRPRGAFPVHGGGVQFDFEHTTDVGHKVDTSVQIRPEHLGDSNHLKRGLAGLHQILLSGGAEIKRPFGDSEYNYAGASRPHAGFSSWWRANVSRPSFFGQGNSSSSGVAPFNRPAPAPLSTEAGGITRLAPGGIPEYTAHDIPPDWVKRVYQQRPSGHGAKDEEGYAIPLPGAHTHATAGAWGYRYKDQFIPAGRPDVQKHIESVHDELASNPDLRARRDAQMRNNITPSTSGGRAYFNSSGDYIPAGVKDRQMGWEKRYNDEEGRIGAGEARVRQQHGMGPAQRLFGTEGGGHITEDTKHLQKDEARAQQHMSAADAAIDSYIRQRGVTKVPAASASGAGSQHEHFGTHKPTFAKRLFK